MSRLQRRAGSCSGSIRPDTRGRRRRLTQLVLDCKIQTDTKHTACLSLRSSKTQLNSCDRFRLSRFQCRLGIRCRFSCRLMRSCPGHIAYRRIVLGSKTCLQDIVYM
jgi:hypothetical protein